MKKRGFVFTLDALLSLVLVLVVVTSITVVEESSFQVYSSVMRTRTLYTAEDVVTVLSNVPLNSLVNESVIENWTSSGVLNTSLFVSPSTPPLKIALTYWALSNISAYRGLNLTGKAATILDYVIRHNFPGYGYQLSINSTVIAGYGNITSATDVTSVSTVMSGFRKGKKPFGYVSRAYLTYAQHFYSNLIGIQRLVALGRDYRGDYNTLHIKVPVNLPGDAVDVTAKGAFYARITPFNDIYLTVINESGSYDYGDLGSGEEVDLTGYIGPGRNVLSFRINSGGADEVGFGSGSVLLVSYSTNSTSVESPDKIDLYDVTSHYGFVQFLTIVPTGNVTGMSVYLKADGINRVHLYYNNGTSICDTGISRPFQAGVVYINSTEIEEGLRNCGITYQDLGNRAFTIVLAFDATWDSDSSTPHYDDTYRERHLYGFGDSFVQLEVQSKLKAIQFGIPLSLPLYPEDFNYSDYLFSSSTGEDVYSTMEVSYSLPPRAIPWYADYWVAIMYRGTPTGTLKFTEENPVAGSTEILSGPLNYYLYRFGYSRFVDSIMMNGTTNTLIGESSSSSYGFREGESWGNVYYFLQAYAPYGRSFSKLLQGYPDYRGYNLTYWATLYGSSMNPVRKYILIGREPYLNVDITELDPDTYAVDDAIIRLFTKLAVNDRARPGTRDNPLGVLLPRSVKMEFSAMTAPSLFTPVSIELRLWRLG